MATGADQGDTLHDLLTCSICLETFKDPRYLPCLHTFCKSCICTFIVSSVETEGGFPCPVCRKLVQNIASTDDKETVADTLSVNHFIVSLLDKKAIQRSEKLCDACDVKKIKTQAVSWCTDCEEAFCEQCENSHRSFKMLAGHTIAALANFKQGDILQTSINHCSDHPKREIEVYCVDHTKPCCTLCATLSHRKCDSVISIEEAARGCKDDTNKLIEQIDQSEHVLDKIVQNRKQNLANVETQSDAISSDISKMKRDIIHHLNSIESEIQTKLAATRKQLSLQLTDDVDRFQSHQSALIKWKTLLQGALDHGSDKQCLVTLNGIKEKVEYLNIELKKKIPDVRHVSIEYNAMSSALAKFSDTMKSFGNIEVKENKINVDIAGIKTIETDFHSGEIKILHTVNVDTHGMSSGIYFGDNVLFTVCNSQEVKKYSNEFIFLSKLQGPKSPKDIDVIDNTRVVVSSCQENQVYIIDGINMIILKTIPLINISPYGVCYFRNNHVIVGSGKTITWVDMTSGAKIKSVTTFGHSFYVSSNKNNDYISADGPNSVSCVVDGTKKFTYTNNELRFPRGVGIDYHGNMYIAGVLSYNIHQITNEGNLVRIISPEAVGVTRPWTIRFKPNSNRFVVSCNESGKASICEIV